MGLARLIRERDSKTTHDQLDRDQPLTDAWVPLQVKLRKRKWRCDLIQLYPNWVVNEKAYVALEPLLRGSVEFLPLVHTDGDTLWVIHALQHVELGSKAIHNASSGSNMTVIEKYDFEVSELKGKHLFRVKQAPVHLHAKSDSASASVTMSRTTSASIRGWWLAGR